jgi:hypothetical protein
MRRKKRFGVYSNTTLKRCPCCVKFCVICKGKCKAEVLEYTKGEDFPENHPIVYKKKRITHFGRGSLKPGRKFVFKVFTHHKDIDYHYGDKISRHNRKLKISQVLSEQLIEYSILKDYY